MKELQGEPGVYSDDAAAVRAAYDAPFDGLGDDGVTGPRRFPMSIPVHDPDAGNAAAQAQQFEIVKATQLPVHFVWGTLDVVFTTEWGQRWHSMIPHSTWDEVPAGHFLQDTHGTEIVARVLGYVG